MFPVGVRFLFPLAGQVCIAGSSCRRRRASRTNFEKGLKNTRPIYIYDPTSDSDFIMFYIILFEMIHQKRASLWSCIYILINF
ncbi:hypothetical protein [Methanimicrococcus hongohii]|uniref:hypothetical protein n=1 Tax=Methanimicrococcus hongohii TaxID=3028295 RepID=UPI002931E665|nr:hypothetical protein [Methanimicrococcus sp. Hf6]